MSDFNTLVLCVFKITLTRKFSPIITYVLWFVFSVYFYLELKRCYDEIVIVDNPIS